MWPSSYGPEPPAGGSLEKYPSGHKAGFFGWLVLVFSVDGSQGLGTEVALGMQEEKFTPSGCDSPWMKIN